ncbi:large neutral amino acids transporter small subunit 2 [Trichonephila clavata]|uniref:Large neutral amino acids transporter small subunit 2 n=2 Tax=Trichonephila clavata TaxID=2740835 RepID=A0A8X6LAE6_TRICU|nr:large neutral amino acids transporter small subunit 2 [Trichonephila clavata]
MIASFAMLHRLYLHPKMLIESCFSLIRGENGDFFFRLGGILTFVNCWDVKWSMTVQNLFTFAKLVALVIIILTGVVQLCYGQTQHFNFEGSESDITKIALSFYSGLFAYNGWNYLNFVIEELKILTSENLPRAIFISCILVTVVYTFTVVAFHTTLSVAEVLGAEAVAVTFADSLYGSMAWVMPVFVAMSTYGGVNGILFTSSRLFYAGAEQGQMPRILAMIQVKHLTPAPAVIAMALLSILYLCSSDIYALINYVGFATWLAIGLAVACLPYLRWKQPNLARPIKVHLIFPIIYIIATIFITVVPMMADPVGTGFGALIIATGVPVYLIFIYWENKPKAIRHAIDGATRTLQKMFVVVPAEKTM